MLFEHKNNQYHDIYNNTPLITVNVIEIGKTMITKLNRINTPY